MYVVGVECSGIRMDQLRVRDEEFNYPLMISTSHPDCSSDYGLICIVSERNCLDNAIPHDPWAN